MSLLGTQVYANSGQNIWLPVTGGIITGNLLVDGAIDATGNINSDADMTADNIVLLDSVVIQGNANSAVLTTDVTGATLNVTAQTSVTFGRDTVTPNTTLTLSAPGAGLDNLTTNFLYAIGPVPTNIITSPKTINPVPTSPATPFIVDTAFPVASGQVYDVQATGVITLASGTPNASDAVIIQLDAGTGTSVTSYTYYPSGAGQSGNWSIRQRIVGNATQPSLAVAVNQLLAGGSTAVYAATMNYFSAVRVA